MTVDLWFFELINGLAGHTPGLDQLMQALVSDYVGPTLQVLVLLGFWFEGSDAVERRESQRTIMRAVVAWRADGLPAYYSGDAGPNVHCFCEERDAAALVNRLQALPGVQQVHVSHPGGAAHLLSEEPA